MPQDNYYELLADVRDNGMAIKNVPSNMIDYTMCLAAVKRSPSALRHVPDMYLTKELVKLAGQGIYNAIIAEKMRSIVDDMITDYRNNHDASLLSTYIVKLEDFIKSIITI